MDIVGLNVCELQGVALRKYMANNHYFAKHH